MVLIKNSTGNVYKTVAKHKVDDYLRKGFIIVEERGGNTPPPAPRQDEKQPALQETIKDIEPAIIEEVKENPLMMDGRYAYQLNRHRMMEWMDREGLSYNKRATKAELVKIYTQYKKELKSRCREVGE